MSAATHIITSSKDALVLAFYEHSCAEMQPQIEDVMGKADLPCLPPASHPAYNCRIRELESHLSMNPSTRQNAGVTGDKAHNAGLNPGATKGRGDGGISSCRRGGDSGRAWRGRVRV